MKCPVCNTINSPDAVFCKQCGAKLEVNQCPKCKATVDPGARFCSKCGTRLVPNDSATGRTCQSCGFVNTSDSTYCKRCNQRIL